MPVKRKREEVRSTAGSGGVVASPRSAMSNVMRRNAQEAAQRAHAYGQLMATEAEDEAMALAKAATFSTGPNGMPQLPPNPTKRMGDIAQRTYDRALQDRFVHQMTTAVRAQVSDAETANMYDHDAFVQDAQSRIDQMAADVPEGYQGAFQQVSTSALASGAATIGRRQAQQDARNTASRIPVQVQDHISTIKEAIWAGQDDRARMLSEQLDWLDRIPSHIMTDGEKADARDSILYSAAETRMVRDLDLDNRNPGELTDLATRLSKGDDKELMKYFTSPDGTVHHDWAVKAAGKVNQFLAKANRTARAEAERMEEGQRVDRITAGVANPDSKKNRATADRMLSEELGLEDPDNPGTRRQISWADWLTMDQEARDIAVPFMKSTGVVPSSFRDAMKRLENRRDPAEMTAAFRLLRDLDEGPNFQGVTASYMEHVPDKVKATYEMVSLMHGDGEMLQEDVVSAMEKVYALDDQEWGDEQLARRMNGDNGWMDGRGSVTADTAREGMRRDVVQTIFDGVQALPKEKDEAVRLFETYYRLGQNFDEAMELTRQSFEGRYVESRFMAGAARSAYAPEKHYAARPSSSVGEYVGDLAGRGAGELVDQFEWLYGFIPGLHDEATFQNLGAYMKATPFERMASDRIKDMLAEHPDAELRDALWPKGDDRAKGQFLVGGEDYKLTPTGRGGDLPVYNVLMRIGGQWVPTGTLDVRADWRAMMRAELTAKEIMKETDERERERKFDEFMSGKDGTVERIIGDMEDRYADE